MIPRIVEAKHVHDFTVRLRYDDGMQGEVDLSLELSGPIFKPLRDVEYFRRFRLHPELRTLVWPNGADFALEFLRDRLNVCHLEK